MERKNILLLKTGISRYNCSDKYIEEWAAAIRKLGCNTCVLDGWSLAHPMLYNHVLATKHFDAVFDLNGMFTLQGIHQKLSSESIYSIYLCDPPFCVDAQDKLGQFDERTVVFACDRNFCDYVKRYFPMVKHTNFIPLSGNFYPVNVPYEERSIDILFTGSYESPLKQKEKVLERFEKGSVMAQFVEDMLEDIIENPQYTLPECLSRILMKYHQEVSDSDFHELVIEFAGIDFYARFYYRDKVIRTLLDAGLKIDVFGNGWENFQAENKEKLVIHQGNSYAASKALANAKIALNIMPWFKDGFQERIASAMLSGTVAVTDESKYILENFKNDSELLIFSLKDIESLPKRIKYLFEHSEEAARIAENGRKKADSHTWFARTYEMLRDLEEHFSLSFIQEGEGKQLEFDLEYPNQHTLVSDAVYELHKMAAFAENDMGKIEKISKEDAEYLIKQFNDFTRKFSKQLKGLDMSEYVRNCLHNTEEKSLEHVTELFALQCKALMSSLLLEEQGIKI